MTAAKKRGGRQRGAIDALPSGSFRVRVAAGTDPLTGRRLDLTDVAPTRRDAEKLRTKLLNEVDERRNARTKATVNALFDRYLEVVDLDGKTRKTYEGYIENHIRPALGHLPVGRLDGEVLDTFYAQLRRCRARCRAKGRNIVTDHRTTRAHECNERCAPHACKPLSPATIRQIHWILSGALTRAVRWRWIANNPTDSAQPPAPSPPKPTPPSAAEAARIVQAAFDEDAQWGTLIWLFMTTGARRGEICALRRSYVDFDAGVLTIPASISEVAMREKDTKTHQQRRVSIDEATVELLRELVVSQDLDRAKLGLKPSDGLFVFSFEPTADRPMHPSSVTHKYGRLVDQLSIATTLHKLRHYNATELLAAGVDVRTVAGRLGHGGGGTTTLRVYAAWVREADRRAASALSERFQHVVARGFREDHGT